MIDRWDKYIHILKIELLPYQQELALKLLSFPKTAKITQCRQSGKSFILGIIAYFLAYALHWDIVVTAPKVDQTWNIMKHVHKAHSRFKAKHIYSNKYGISLRNRGSIHCLSGSETANVEGSSAHVVIIDEHQDIPKDHAAEVFLPMLSWYAKEAGLYWTSGIGANPGSVATMEAELEWILPYDKVIEVKEEYSRLVEQARKEMLPEQFKAHYECKDLDISSHLLIPSIEPYISYDSTNAYTICGIDFGKRVDSSIITVTDHVGDYIYIKDWCIPTGTYDEQIDTMLAFLHNTPYDEVIPESNGVGDVPCDILVSRLNGIKPLQVNQPWKTRQAQRLHKKAGNKTLLYNDKHDLAPIFLKDITSLSYKMLDSKNIKVDHSDFLSSLMLTMERTGTSYL